jgi:hypothetical protein
MVCFDRGNQKMVFMFVMKKSALKDPPPQSPTQAKVGGFVTASWTRGDKMYLLASPDEPDFRKYLPQL